MRRLTSLRATELLTFPVVLRLGLSMLFAGTPSPQAGAPTASAGTGPARIVIEPTPHPPVPTASELAWLAPEAVYDIPSSPHPYAVFARAVELRRDDDLQAAHDELELVRADVAATPLAGYAVLLGARIAFDRGRFDDARDLYAGLRATAPPGALGEEAALGEARAREGLGDAAGAADIYRELLTEPIDEPDLVLDRLGLALLAAGDRAGAYDALMRVYYDYPLSDFAAPARELATGLASGVSASVRDALQSRGIERADRLFAGRAWSLARQAYRTLRDSVTGEVREHVDLRLAAANLRLGRFREARDASDPYRTDGTRQDEARALYLRALLGLGLHDEFVQGARALQRDFPRSEWTARTLDELGSHFLRDDEDTLAASVFEQLYVLDPVGAYAERAAWQIGWWWYKHEHFADAIRIFESAAADFPRSDYRPAFLYWTGRAYDRLGDPMRAHARFRVAVQDYGGSYYGRLALRRLEEGDRQARHADDVTELAARHAAAGIVPVEASGDAGFPPSVPLPTADVIRALLSVGLEDEALAELRYARRRWGSSPRVEATIAWILHQGGDLRQAINAMKRAYPQYLTHAAHDLPRPVLEVLYPVRYWDLIRSRSEQHGLDPFMMAALIAQESTFQADVRSSANAYGLMQIVPATGRLLARLERVRFSLGMLTDAETNIRFGTRYFARLIDRLGAPHFALAAYNAGDSRVVRWQRERPSLEADEFIDDIPFPETRNYVKRVLGTAEDYRLLYGE